MWLPGTTGRASNAWTPCHKVEQETSAWTGCACHTYPGVNRLASGRSSTWRTVRAFSVFQVSLKHTQHLRTSLELFIQKYLSLSSQCQSRFAHCLTDTSWELPGKQNTRNKILINYWLRRTNIHFFLFHYWVHWNSVLLLYPKIPFLIGIASKEGRSWGKKKWIFPTLRNEYLIQFYLSIQNYLCVFSINNRDFCPCRVITTPELYSYSEMVRLFLYTWIPLKGGFKLNTSTNAIYRDAP